MKFRKVHGAGNDFVLLAGSSEDLRKDWSGTARTLCSRRIGIGADGLVVSALLDNAPDLIGVACFNADGSVATMCGNALRCVALCAAADYSLRDMTLVMSGVKHKALVRDTKVEVTAEVGAVDLRLFQAVWNGRPFWFDSANTGTEHVVAVVEDVDAIDAAVFGRLVRNHHQLAPIGSNVNFIQAAGPSELKIRTYERGVEAETLSCGSGAVAAVVIASHRGLVGKDEVTVHNESSTPLTVRPHWDRPGRTYWVGGPVTHVFEGALA
ncbi:diaminopimelate epimerase [Streptomyces sp. NPDC094438]|uniref:diaminopimelate epimerase n=1 Tax=Streptomyces sp. NPDC094438 TaxID=3366061 RepID=UPI0037FE9D2C